MLKFLQLEIFFLCLLFPVIFTAKPCANIPPFLNRLRDGVDITKLDLLPLSLASNDGFRNPVIDYTCDFNITRNLDGIVYSIPDQVWSIVNIPSGLLDTRVEIHKNSHSFKNSLAVKVGIKVFGGLFSSSLTYKKVQSYFSSGSKYVEDLTSHTAGYKVNMMPEWGLEFGQFAKIYIEKFLPHHLNDTTFTKYMRFIETFGTHYFKQGRFGGILRLFLATDTSYFRKGSEKNVEIEAKSIFKKILSIGGTFSMSTKSDDSKFAEASRKFVRYYGGKTNLLAEDSISTWQPTVLKNPWLYGGGLVEISGMIEDDTKRLSMQKAVQMYTDKAFLSELMRDFKARYKYNHWSKVDILQFANKARELMQKPMPIHSEVMNLVRMISPAPDWYKEIRLCFQWTYLYYNSQKCDEGHKRQICAKPGYRYSLYRSTLTDKDKPSFSCPVQWGFFSVGYENWFKNFGLCFRWNDNINAGIGKCGKQKNETVCGQLNSFVSLLLSSKDNSYCQMEWILSIPKQAPVWLQKTKIYMRYRCLRVKRYRGKPLYIYKYMYADASQYRSITPSLYSKGHWLVCQMHSFGITHSDYLFYFYGLFY
ncbi:perivitellin-2 67 kDa subunit-like [Mytilus galloprovincialis]|uniref:perivitellin-2 67 kDa subunit-like n=1 Tax=Mytilus galloprovincialis TaxID=29158 RepID=UPI003F7C0492